jgi:nicotinamidase-related amidase
MASRSRLVDAARALLLVIDLQEGYRGKLHEGPRTLERAGLLIRGARCLGLPVLYTEQYPKGLGPTLPEIQALLGDAPCFEKRSISALGAAGLRDALTRLGRSQLIVCGIETHACINQSAHELLDAGYDVHLPADAISARSLRDHEPAWQKMIGSGAVPGSVESVLLECLRSSEHPDFKAVQALLK